MRTASRDICCQALYSTGLQTLTSVKQLCDPLPGVDAEQPEMLVLETGLVCTTATT